VTGAVGKEAINPNASHATYTNQTRHVPTKKTHQQKKQKSTTKYGNEHEAIAVYSMMRAVQKFCPIYTLCVGNAFGEAALLLAAGSKGKRAALRSATIMIRQPLQRLAGMQASDIDIYRRVTREKTTLMVRAVRMRMCAKCYKS
jgi:predicted alpha/beta-fold hydrolase